MSLLPIERPATRAQRPQRQRIAGLLLGAVTIGFGAVCLAGWLFRIAGLAHPFGPTPVYANAAVGLVACGIALVGLAQRQHRVVLTAGAIALLIGGATFIQHAFGVDLRIDTLLADDFMMRGRMPGRMPAISALALAFTGLAVILLETARRPGLQYSFVGVLGSTVAALALVDLLVGVTGLMGTLRRGLLLGAAIPEMVTFFLIGAATTWFAWERDAAQPELPRWLPVAAGLGVLVTTVFVWRALVAEQNQLIDVRLAAASRTVQRAVNRRLETLRHLTRVHAHQAAVAAAPDDWVRTSDALVPPETEVQERWWLADDGSPRASIPAAIGEERTVIVRQILEALPRVTDSVAVLGVGGDPTVFALAAPACDGSACVGSVVLFVATAPFMELATRSEDLDVNLVIASREQVVFSAPEGTPWIASAEDARRVGPAVLGWRLEVTPTPEVLADLRTTVPEVILGLGTLLAVLLTITLRLAQTAFERAREFERQRMALALENTTDGIWEWNVRTGEADRSRSIWKRLGYDADAVGQGMEAWTSRIHPEDRPRYDAAVKAHLERKSPALSIEYRVRANDGEWHWIVDQGRVVQDTAWGQPQRMLGLVADITERKRADAILAESEHRFRAIFESGLQLQALLDLECRLLEVNPVLLEFGGLSLADVRGKALWEGPWWPESTEQEQRLRSACSDALEGNTVRFAEEIRGADNRVASIEYSIKPIVSADGTVTQLLFEGRDVTERKRAEAVLREMNTLTTMGRLAAHVAHEINNPLAGIQNSFLLIKDAIPETHPHFTYVGAIEREMARIARVTRQLYETYRHGQEEDREASIAMEASDAVSLLSQLNRSKQVSITLDTDGVPTAIPIPSAIVRQTLFNLVQNAVDASPAGGRVAVRARVIEQRLRLSVQDDGPGVPEELRERVFEPFFSTKSDLRTGGMGIGLSLVRRSIEALGGRVWITDGNGTGAEFQVEIPLSPFDPAQRT